MFLVLPDPRCFVIDGLIAIGTLGRVVQIGRYTRVVQIGTYTLCVALSGSVADLIPEATVTASGHQEALTARRIVINLTPN